MSEPLFLATPLAFGIAIGLWLGIRRERKYGAVVLEGEMDERYDEGYEAGFQEGKRVMRDESRQRAEYIASLLPGSDAAAAFSRAFGGPTHG